MFRRPHQHYGKSPEPVTPYQRAAQIWDDRIGSARIQAKNWRLAFFGCLALSGGLASALVWQSLRGTITPWVFDDGRQLFVEFSPSIATGEMPPLFAVGEKGAAELLNYRVDGRFMIVDRLFDSGELRLGAGAAARKVRIVRDVPAVRVRP